MNIVTCTTDNAVILFVMNKIKTKTFSMEISSRLRDLIAREEACYLKEMEDKEETVLERQAKMRERAKFLKDKRESERLDFVQGKYDQQFRFV